MQKKRKRAYMILKRKIKGQRRYILFVHGKIMGAFKKRKDAEQRAIELRAKKKRRIKKKEIAAVKPLVRYIASIHYEQTGHYLNFEAYAIGEAGREKEFSMRILYFLNELGITNIEQFLVIGVDDNINLSEKIAIIEEETDKRLISDAVKKAFEKAFRGW
jgi:hypothetical protein